MLDLYKTIENGHVFNAYMLISSDVETCLESADRICGILNVLPENRFLFESGKVDDARELINSISIKPFSEQKKIAVVNGDKLSLNAANCILKTLEDPPDFAVFIIMYTNESNALPTIESRCVKYYLDTFSYDAVLEELGKRRTINAETFAAYADGNLNNALKLCGESGFLTLRKRAVEFFSAYIYGEIIDIAKELKDDAENLLSQMLIFLNDCCSIYYKTDKRLRFNDYKDVPAEFIANFTIGQIVSIMNYITELVRLKKQNININLIFDNLKIRLLEVYYADNNRS